MTNTNALTLNGTGIGGSGALINSSTTAGTYAGLITLGSASSIVATSGNITLSNAGTITGGIRPDAWRHRDRQHRQHHRHGRGYGYRKRHRGTWTLSGANTYTGVTTISAGTLKVGNATALGASRRRDRHIGCRPRSERARR